MPATRTSLEGGYRGERRPLQCLDPCMQLPRPTGGSRSCVARRLESPVIRSCVVPAI